MPVRDCLELRVQSLCKYAMISRVKPAYKQANFKHNENRLQQL